MNMNAATRIAPDLNLALIEKAMEKSPTGGNSQPFSWKWEKATLHIAHDAELAEHYLNPNHHASWIGLGCLLTSIEVAARAQGWESTASTKDDLSAVITFAPSVGEVSIVEPSMLAQRTTFRGAFKPSAAPTVPKTLHEGVCVHIASAESISKEFKNYLVTADTYLWLQRKAMDSFFNEVRFFDHRLDLRGIRSEDLGIGIMDQFVLWIFSFVPWLLSIIANVPGLNSTFINASKRSIKNSHFMLVTAKSLDPQTLMKAGQAAMLGWLSMEQQGYRAQPYSMASLTLAAAASGHLPSDTHEKFRKLFHEVGPRATSVQFHLNQSEHPVWMLRVGKN